VGLAGDIRSGIVGRRGRRRRVVTPAAVGLTAVMLLICAGVSVSSSTPPVREISVQEGLPLGSTHELTMGPDGNVWVTQQDQSRLVRITPEGQVRVFPLAPGLGPHGIVFDRHGHMWLALQYVNEIAELNLEGRILRTYRIRRPAEPHGLAIARDGRIWWTGKFGGGIGRLNPRTGRMQVFPLPDRYSQPIYITQGCGAMYFTELTNSTIGSIADDGKITEYRTPTDPPGGGSRPIAVAIRNCRVWFTEERGHRFGVLDPGTGRITEYPVPIPDAMLVGLAFDRAGTLWIEVNRPDGVEAIGRVGADMKVTLFDVPTRNAVLHRIILGPGANMWFTELAVDKVGYIRTR
jgi:virginiamycin B lyase